jgi:aryl-alcohol dehydrogenase-like predicted oxidoreductase
MAMRDLLPSRATAAATAAFARRLPGAAPSHFRLGLGDLTLSSIGLGTGGYRRTPGEERAGQYGEAVQSALQRGVNVIDTAISYGEQLAEQVVGTALATLLERGILSREEIVVASKGGYLPFGPDEFEREFVRTGRCLTTDLVDGRHCLAPSFILDQLSRSRENLRLETIDVYFLHNPEEQLCAMGRSAFAQQIRRAFEALEDAVARGWIGGYGFATAEGFRSEGEGLHRLDEVVSWAREIGGAGHHFRVIQLPVNLGALEAVSLQNHTLDGASASVLDVASALGITVMASASLRRGRFPRPMPEVLRQVCPELTTDAQMALQFTRSLPGVSVALVGMSRSERVEENLQLYRVAPLDLTALAPPHA